MKDGPKLKLLASNGDPVMRELSALADRTGVTLGALLDALRSELSKRAREEQ